MRTVKLQDWQLNTLFNHWHTQQPITLRRCLQCDHWMRSTGPDHRVCNPCKGAEAYLFMGARVGGQGRHAR